MATAVVRARVHEAGVPVRTERSRSSLDGKGRRLDRRAEEISDAVQTAREPHHATWNYGSVNMV
jgi:hypothetical protein